MPTLLVGLRVGTVVRGLFTITVSSSAGSDSATNNNIPSIQYRGNATHPIVIDILAGDIPGESTALGKGVPKISNLPTRS